MLKCLFASFALVFASLSLAPRAEAASIPVVWGMSDHFDTIATLTIPEEFKDDLPPAWTKGAAPELVRHSASFTLCWFLGLSIADKGLAVHVPGGNEYWEVTEDDLKMFQEAKRVPASARDTGIQPMTYVMSFLGHGVIGAFVLVGAYIKSRT